MKKLRVLISLPAGGKTTYAMKLLKEEENWFRVSRDDIRINMFGVEHPERFEGFISKIQNKLILDALKAGYNVVVDNCNIRQSYRNEFYEFAKNVGDVLYEEVVFNTPLAECIARNAVRSRHVPEEIIEKFYKSGRQVLSEKYVPVSMYFPIPEKNILIQNQTLPKAIICDLDGTLALPNGRNPYDASTCEQDLPNIPVLETIKMFKDFGQHEIIFCSGREDKFMKKTENFIQEHFVNMGLDHRSYYLFMRKTGDQRKDHIIKKEIFDNNIRNKFNILFVLDDRNSVVKGWRDIGLTCYQVQDGDF